MAGWTIEEMSIKRGAYMAVQWPRLRGRRFGFGFGGAASAGEFSERKERYDEQIQMYENSSRRRAPVTSRPPKPTRSSVAR